MSESRQVSTEPAACVTLTLRSGERIDPHRHREHQIIYASSGVLSVTTGSGTWIAPPQRAIWIPAGTVHQHRAYGETLLHGVAVMSPERPIDTAQPAVLTVNPLLRELIRRYTDDDPIDDAERSRLLAVLLDQLRHSPHHTVHLPATQDPRLSAACRLAESSLAEPLSLEELGRRCATSGRTLSRLFRAEFGLSYPQWRTQLRLHSALILLAETNSVTTVAHRCGWSSASAFIDVFRRAFGYTPGSRP